MIQTYSPDLLVKMIFLNFSCRTLYFSHPNNNIIFIGKKTSF